MNKNYITVMNETDAKNMLKHVQSADIVAYDTETTGLNVRKDKVIGFSVSAKEGIGYYFPLLVWDGNELVKHSVDSKLAMDILMGLKSKKLIMHNASYDIRITTNDLNVNLLPALYCDTVCLKHAIDEERPFGLKDIAKKIQAHIGLDVEKEANAEQIELKENVKANGGVLTRDKYELFKADTHIIGKYASADTDLTLRVFNYYSKLLKEQGLEKFFYKEETMPLMKEVTIPMEHLGIPVDVDSLAKAQINITKDIQILEDNIQSIIASILPPFNHWYLWKDYPPRRTGSFAQAICKFANLNLPKSDAGRYSLRRDLLDALEPSVYKDFLSGGAYLTDEIVHEIQMNMFKDSGEKYMVNLSSKHHLKKIFFEILHEEPTSLTGKGNPQVNDIFLDIMADKYEWVRLLRDYNKLNKLKSSYIDRFLDQQEDGIFYPAFNQHRTISGRYGSDLQQLSRPYELKQLENGNVSEVVYRYTNMIRKFFIAGKDYKFVDADYESLEPHVFAHVSKDEGLLNIFKKGHDFYSTIAIATEGLEGFSADKLADNYLGIINKLLRQKAKGYSLGIPYGMEAYALGKTLDIPQKEAANLIKKYLRAYPQLASWMEESNKKCIELGYIKAETGRIRHMPSAPKIWNAHGKYILDSLELWKRYNDNPKKYEQMKYLRKQMKNYLNNSKNFQIQSLAASITNRACISINRELKRLNISGYVCAQIHDQIVVRVSDKHAERVRKLVQFLMENTYKISLPLKAPAELGDNFYDAH